MKIGIRTPSLKKSLKARTTGRVKRAVKKSYNPLYGKKGMGIINDPKKCIYNKIYHKTTVSATDAVKHDLGLIGTTIYYPVMLFKKSFIGLGYLLKHILLLSCTPIVGHFLYFRYKYTNNTFKSDMKRLGAKLLKVINLGLEKINKYLESKNRRGK